MKPKLRIKLIEDPDPDIAALVTRLHMNLLPTSPLVLLGKRFIRDFYYTLLPGNGLITLSVAYVDGVPAGFIAVTSDPNGFMGFALRRWWYRIAWLLSVSLLENPTRIGALWEAFQIMTTRKSETLANTTAEFLSLGVLPEFTDPKFVQQSGLRIARELITTGVQQLADTGAERVIAVVDADNLPARIMYYGLGWQLGRLHVPGWRADSVEFIWETAPKA